MSPAEPGAEAEGPQRSRHGFPALLSLGFDRAEGFVTCLALAAMALLPLAEIVARYVHGRGVPGSQPLVQHLTLWVGFLGASLAAREDKLLALATGTFLPEGGWRLAARIFSSTVAVAVTALLFCATVQFLATERDAGSQIALGIPVWVAMLALPISFALIALRLTWKAATTGASATPGAAAPDVAAGPRWAGRGVAALALAGGLALGFRLNGEPELLAGTPAWPVLAVLILATALGAPIYALLGGAALVLFMTADFAVPIAAVPLETYSLTVSQTLPAIPLFTLAGFLLAEGNASQRLIAVFRALFGWVPGGTAVMAAVVCAFFTIFTGGSGVTILALGALLFAALKAENYRENFSLGLLTASGSLGLLLPPALPLILYGIVAEVSMTDLFLGGLVPGVLLVGLVAAWGVREGIVSAAQRTPFSGKAAVTALWRAKWELSLPVFILGAIFSGKATLMEAAALAAVYAFVVQCVVHRELSILRGVPRVLRNCSVLVGGVLLILGVAKGLTNYLVDAQVPDRMVAWVEGHIASQLVFLLALNVFLLVVGCLMDIFSATIVVVPLIVPLGVAFGVDPIHLGIIFIANLELGYLTPPVGLNLFLASYRFERPLLQICRAVVPMLIIRTIGVLLVTYVPWLTMGIFEVLGRTP